MPTSSPSLSKVSEELVKEPGETGDRQLNDHHQVAPPAKALKDVWCDPDHPRTLEVSRLISYLGN